MSGKPTPKGTTQQEEIAKLKDLYLEFFSKFPVQQAAADFIGRTPACIQDWQNNDTDFLASVNRAKAEWAEKNHRKVKPDNLLARLYDDLKPPKQEVEQNVTGNVTINYVRPNDQLQPDSEAGSGLALPD